LYFRRATPGKFIFSGNLVPGRVGHCQAGEAGAGVESNGSALTFERFENLSKVKAALTGVLALPAYAISAFRCFNSFLSLPGAVSAAPLYPPLK